MEHLDLEDDRHREERHFRSLYADVSECVRMEKGVTFEEVRDATEAIISSFHYSAGRRFSDVDYSRYASVCAYVGRLGAHGAGLTRCRVLEAARHCAALRQICTGGGQEPLRVVSLGGGPGNDALGFCSALAELGFRGRGLSVTVTDAVLQWSDCVRHATRLARLEDHGSVSGMLRRDEVTVEFGQARLPVHEGPCHDALRSADIILMTRLLSIVDWDEKPDIAENLYSTMADSTLLILIDVPFEPELWLDFDFLYLSETDGTYRMLRGAEIPSNARVAVLRKHLVVSDSESDSDY